MATPTVKAGSASTASVTNGTTATVTSYVVPTLTNGCLVVVSGNFGNGAIRSPSSIVQGTNTLAVASGGGPYGTDGNNSVELWLLKNPTPQTADLVVTWSVPVYGLVNVFCLEGVDQTTPTGTGNGNTGSGTDASVTVTTVSGDLAVQGLHMQAFVLDTTPSGSQVEIVEAGVGGTGTVESNSITASGASTTMDATWSPSGSWETVGIAFKGAAAAPEGPARMFLH